MWPWRAISGLHRASQPKAASEARKAFFRRREANKSRSQYKVSGREWAVGLGLPAGIYFMGVSLTMDESHLFIGLGLILFAAILMPIDWIYINIREKIFRKLAAIPIFAIGLAYPAWIWFAPYPLKATMEAPKDIYYPTGTSVSGILWQGYYSKLYVIIENDTDATYHNVKAEIESNEWIADARLKKNPIIATWARPLALQAQRSQLRPARHPKKLLIWKQVQALLTF